MVYIKHRNVGDLKHSYSCHQSNVSRWVVRVSDGWSMRTEDSSWETLFIHAANDKRENRSRHSLCEPKKTNKKSFQYLECQQNTNP